MLKVVFLVCVDVVSEGGSGANVATTNVGLSRVVKSVGTALTI